MQKSSTALILATLGAAALGGCSSSGDGLFGNAFTTQAINGSASTNAQAVAAATTKTDPACYTLAQRIDMLRKDGITDRLEKASVGKSTSVQVKRASLAQAAELDKANAEFQARCSTLPRPVQTTAAIPAAQVAGAAPAVANSAQVVSATAPPVIQQPAR
jgi:hypothetical protein